MLPNWDKGMALEKINQVNDIKRLEKYEWNLLAEEIREFLIEKISVNGGHLASNLGVVELTMAMHLAFDFPNDKVVWDVGHQAYTHKLLTGRKEGFDGLRKYGGMSGFPKRKEIIDFVPVSFVLHFYIISDSPMLSWRIKANGMFGP